MVYIASMSKKRSFSEDIPDTLIRLIILLIIYKSKDLYIQIIEILIFI